MFEILENAVKEAAKIIVPLYKTTLEIKTKSDSTDFVTEADIKSQEIIVKILTEGMVKKGFNKKEIGFFGEEGLHEITDRIFIIDPLDGTSGFVGGTDRFSTSIGYMENGEMKAGIIHHPLKDISYYGEKGKGAFRIKGEEKDPLNVEEKPLHESSVSINTSSNKKTATEMFRAALNLIPHVLRIREQGTLCLSLVGVAENKFQAHLSKTGSLWDIAAGKVIMEEAGGTMVDFKGHQIDIDLSDFSKKYPVIVTNKRIVEDLVKYINE